MKTVYVKEGDKWPEAVSDGLTLPCGICEEIPATDYIIDHDMWDKVVPKEMKLGVVCLDCLVGLDPNVIEHIKSIFVCGGGKSIHLEPDVLYDYTDLSRKAAARQAVQVKQNK